MWRTQSRATICWVPFEH